MPPSRDSFRRNRVAPVDASILPPFASGRELASAGQEQDGTSGSRKSPSLEMERRVLDRYPSSGVWLTIATNLLALQIGPQLRFAPAVVAFAQVNKRDLERQFSWKDLTISAWARRITVLIHLASLIS
jgi:hypothetical protein